ncbi:hypothetical protein ACQ0QQ_00605 [Lysinibacillus sphaericus]
MLLKRTRKADMSPLKKSVLQTGILLFWMIGIIFLFILGNLLLEINKHGFEKGVKSTAFTLEILSNPVVSPLKWSSQQEPGIHHLVVNMTVFYAVFTFGFWVRQYFKVAGVILLLLFFIASVIWYYVYFLSYAVI